MVRWKKSTVSGVFVSVSVFYPSVWLFCRYDSGCSACRCRRYMMFSMASWALLPALFLVVALVWLVRIETRQKGVCLAHTHSVEQHRSIGALCWGLRASRSLCGSGTNRVCVRALCVVCCVCFVFVFYVCVRVRVITRPLALKCEAWSRSCYTHFAY